MSNYHILESNEEDNQVRIVFHIPVPNENNSAGANLRQALSQFRANPGSAVPWQQSGTEYEAIQNGEIYEHDIRQRYKPDLTNAQKQTAIDNNYNNLKTKIANRLRKTLKYWGKNRDVP